MHARAQIAAKTQTGRREVPHQGQRALLRPFIAHTGGQYCYSQLYRDTLWETHAAFSPC